MVGQQAQEEEEATEVVVAMARVAIARAVELVKAAVAVQQEPR